MSLNRLHRSVADSLLWIPAVYEQTSLAAKFHLDLDRLRGVGYPKNFENLEFYEC